MVKRRRHRLFGNLSGIHYAWVIIVIAAIMHMAGGSVRQAFGVLVIPLHENMGWSPASVTLGFAISNIIGAVVAPFSGIATDRYGARKVIMFGVVFFLLGSIITGAANQVWHIWISYGICLGIAQACFNVPILTAATYWFRRRLALGMGLLQAAHGIGPAVMAVLLSVLLSATTWKSAFWLIGISSTVVMVVLMLFFRNEPSQMGLRPYGALADEPVSRERNPVLDRLRSRTFLASMQGTNAFWQLVAVHFMGCVGHAIVIVYIIPIAVIAGVDSVSAAGILSTVMAVSVLTRFSTPVIADYLGARRAMAFMFVLQGLPVLMLFWTHDLWQFYLFAVIFGIGYGGEGSAFPIINRQYFGRGPMGRSFGWQQAGAGTGMAFGGWIGGVLFGVFGSYDITVVLSVLASVGGAALIFSMPPTDKLLIPDWEESIPSTTLTGVASPVGGGE